MTAPAIVLRTPIDNHRPSFYMVAEGLVASDVVKFQKATQADFSDAQEIQNQVDVSELANTRLQFAFPPILDGVFYFRSRVGNGEWSNTIEVEFTSLDLDTFAWVQAVKTAGGTVSATQEQRVNALVLSLKSKGLWSGNGKLDHLWILAGEVVSQQTLIDIVGLKAATKSGTPAAFDAHGYTGSVAGTFVIDTNFNNNQTGDNFGAGDACMGGYISTMSTAGSFLGCFTSGNFDLKVTSSNVGAAIANNNGGGSGTHTAGMYAVDLTATTIKSFKNGGTELYSGTHAAEFFNNSDIFAFARNDGVSADLYTNGRMGMFFFGGHMTAGELDDLYAAIQAYMTAWGVQV